MLAASILKRLNAEALILVTVVIWGANYPLAKFGLGGMHPFVFNAIRYITAAAVLMMVSASRPGTIKIDPRDRWKLLWAGLVANVLYQVVFIIGLDMTTSGNSAVILSTSPLWTVFLHARMHHENIPRPMLAGMVLSVIGVFFIILGSGKSFGFSGREFEGGCILLVAAFLWGLNTNLQKPLLRTYSPTHLSVILISVGAVGLTGLAVPYAVHANDGLPGLPYLFAAVLSGAFSIGIGNLFWSYGVKVLGPGKTSSFNNLVPVIALVLSYVYLQERLVPVQIAGAAMTIAGVWAARR